MEKLALVILFVILLFFFLYKKKNKHQRNIISSKKIISKINNFKHPGQKINYLRKTDPFVFEEILLTAFENNGYNIKRNKRYTGDNGIDGVVYNKKGETFLIQAKRYSNYINLQHVKDFNEILLKKGYKGFFIHSGKTGKKSKDEFRGSNMVIISGNNLIKLINNEYKEVF